MKPYIGITDFMNYEQVVNMLEVFFRHRPHDSERVLHVGVMMSYKTLNDIETRWSKAFPRKQVIADIFSPISGELIYNCLHYADYNHDTTRWSDLSDALGYALPDVHAIQLDMPWPDPAILGHGFISSRGQELEVILQIGGNAIQEANNNPTEVVRRLEDYEGLIHRVLLDKSMGRGLGMDAKTLIPFARAIRERFPTLGLVAAGGLGPETTHLVEPLVAEFPDLSIDAQGQLRPSGNALDPIDWSIAERYLIKALELFQ